MMPVPVNAAPEEAPLLDKEGAPNTELPPVLSWDHLNDEADETWGRKLARAWSPSANLRSLVKRPRDALGPVDGLRAWAVIWVIMYHCLSYWRLKGKFDSPSSQYNWQQFRDSHSAQVFVSGEMGVDIFFVLSGFLIAHQLIAEFTRLRTIRGARFLLRRWLRLMPAYVLAFPIYTLIPALNDNGPGLPHQSDVCKSWWWTNLLFINNYIGPQDEKACLGHTWTIAVEFQFYLLSPAIVIAMLLPAAWAKISAKKALGAILPFLLIVGCIIVRLVLMLSYRPRPALTDPVIYNKTYARCAPYLFGMLVALALHDPEKPSLLFGRQRARSFEADAGNDAETAQIVQSHPAYDYDAYKQELERIMNWPQHARHFVFALAWLGLSYTGAGGQPNYPDWANFILQAGARAVYGASIAYFLHMTLTDRAKPLCTVLSWRVWTPFARLSYSAYLFQFLGILGPAKIVSLENSSSLNAAFGSYIGICALAIPATFGIAFISYMLIEGPFMRLRP